MREEKAKIPCKNSRKISRHGFFRTGARGIFRTLLNIYDGPLFEKRNEEASQ